MLRGQKVSIIGGGNMGEVLARGIISAGLTDANNVTISDVARERLDYLGRNYGVNVTGSNSKALENAAVVILAVKPQNMGEVLRELSGFIGGGELFISIAAGIPLRFLEENLGGTVRVIRVMPNTPALIGAGAAALAAGSYATEKDLALARGIFNSVGITVIVEEALIDAVTGLSGSGPAYGFMIIEALKEGGVKMGLDEDTALTLAAQTLLGAAKLCLLGDKTPSELTEMVTSPGGTTIEGIKALERGNLKETLVSAVEAATFRSKELGRGEK
ncbi:MAG: pyrroline-5-carboxylate reductase [Deltaproteobacteria bacterium]|nr:pyrroline-5-carboxylate reductase [Deltaproteobacteria bacterium]MBN2846529.1 pyrroline-5-carboxylate reductase [Deltaproteobacteria bacterium]